MKDIVVGIGEILWDMLPEGKNWEVHLPILHIMYHNSDLTAVR